MLPIFNSLEDVERYLREQGTINPVNEYLLESLRDAYGKIETALNFIEDLNTDSIKELQQGIESVKDMLEYGY
jgi:molecular chaperone GrpE (heat shock protein)